jgi:hypothetical protein
MGGDRSKTPSKRRHVLLLFYIGTRKIFYRGFCIALVRLRGSEPTEKPVYRENRQHVGRLLWSDVVGTHVVNINYRADLMRYCILQNKSLLEANFFCRFRRYYRPEELHCGRLATHLHNEIFESNLSDENEISSVRNTIQLRAWT